MRFAFDIFPDVDISVRKFLLTSTVLEEVFELSSIFGASYVVVISLAILPIVNPLTLIIVSLG
jgi:hypothetical protein